MWRYIPCAFFSSATPLAILEYKYNKSHKELLSNVMAEDFLQYGMDCIVEDKSLDELYKKQIAEIRESSRKIKNWQSDGPRIQLFTSVPTRWRKD